MHKHFFRILLKHPDREDYHTIRVTAFTDETNIIELTRNICRGLDLQGRKCSDESRNFFRSIRPTRFTYEGDVRHDWPRVFMTEVDAAGNYIRACYLLNQPVTKGSPGRFGFLHPSKTGGTMLERYCSKHYAHHISGTCHDNGSWTVIDAGKTPFMLVRDPVDRVRSLYKYWKKGGNSEYYRKDPRNIPPHSIGKFVDLIRTEKWNELCNWYMLKALYRQQTWWLKEEHWQYTHMGMYSKTELGKVVTDMFIKMGLMCKEEPPCDLPVVNQSKQIDESLDLTEEDLAWIKCRYRDDYKLLNAMMKTPEKFKSVSGEWHE